MHNEDLKGGLNHFYREKNRHVAAYAVTTEIRKIFSFTHIKHDGAMYANRKGHIILMEEFHQ